MIYHNELPVDIHTFCMAKSLKKLGIPHELAIVNEADNDEKFKHCVVFNVSGVTYAYERGLLRKRVKCGTQIDYININHEADLFVSDKNKTKRHLASENIKTPCGEVFRRRKLDGALAAFEKLYKPVCVKPNNGRGGDRVFTNIKEEKQFLNALHYVAEKYVNIIVEKHIDGEHFRFFYVKPGVVGIKLGVPFSVRGDGASSVSMLIKKKNKERQLRNIVTHPVLEFCSKMQAQLDTQNIKLSDIPKKGETVFLKASAGLDEGADAIVLDMNDIHPSYIQIVERACASIPSMTIAGVDIIIEDKLKPAQDNYAILEINVNPAISPFYFPWEGPEVDVAEKIIEMLRSIQ